MWTTRTYGEDAALLPSGEGSLRARITLFIACLLIGSTSPAWAQETPSAEPDVPAAESPSDKGEPDAAAETSAEDEVEEEADEVEEETDEPEEAEAPTAPAASQAAASSEEPESGSSLDVYHTPPAIWVAGEQQVLPAVVASDWSRERTWVGVRPHPSSVMPQARFKSACTRKGHTYSPQQGGFCEIDIQRTSGNAFSATVDGTLIQPPGVEYYIASRTLDGAYLNHFASAGHPYGVAVEGQSDETRRAELLARHDGHTSRAEVTGDFTSYGPTLDPAGRLQTNGRPAEVDGGSDFFWTISPSYTFRPLRTLYAFRFGVNIIRGSIPEVGGQKIDVDSYSPGMYSGFGELDLELHRLFSLAGRVHLGATEEGFAVGAGGQLRIGPRYATHLELGLDAIMRIGLKTWLRFGWSTVPRFPMALTIETTEYPQTTYKIRQYRADGSHYVEETERALGLRLMLDVGYEINDAITVGLRGGYATRLESVSPGFVMGANVSLEF